MPQGIYVRTEKHKEAARKLPQLFKLGHPVSLDTRRRIGLSNRGNKSHLGIKHSDEAKRKMSLAKLNNIPWNKGKHHSEKTKRLISRINTGKRGLKKENNPNWKGGITPVLASIRTTLKYKQWRKFVFVRDKYTCLVCGKTGGAINAHHIKPFSKILLKNKIWTRKEAINCLELWDINNGVTLCIDCHKITRSYGGNAK